jgi:hypothetical protein
MTFLFYIQTGGKFLDAREINILETVSFVIHINKFKTFFYARNEF